MSNDWEMPEHEEKMRKYESAVRLYFVLNETEIRAFASEHDLRIDEFTRGSSTWDLGAKHPKGGWLTIFIGLSDGENVRVSGSWATHEYETFSMYWKNTDFIDGHISEVKLTDWLGKALTVILAWNIDDLEIVEYKGSCKKFWESFKDKKEWEHSFRFWPQQYPKP